MPDSVRLTLTENASVRGYGKTPKAYFLTRKGWDCIGTIAKKLKLGRATVKKYLRISMGLLQSPAA